jgi:hypothetical protein
MRGRVAVAIVLVALGLAYPEPIEDAILATIRIIAGGRSSTAFIVSAEENAESGKYLLVTASHAFQKDEKICKLVLRIPDEKGEVTRKEVEVNLQTEDGKSIIQRHPKVDIAILPVELPKNAIFKAFSQSQIAGKEFVEQKKVYTGQDVYIPCFPVGIESNRLGWCILRKGVVASFPLSPIEKFSIFFIDYSTFGGDSGAPVVIIDDGKPVVIGVVIGMMRQTDVVKIPFEERVVHTPIGLAMAVHSAFVKEMLRGR